jgi:hypothetical protein
LGINGIIFVKLLHRKRVGTNFKKKSQTKNFSESVVLQRGNGGHFLNFQKINATFVAFEARN